MLADEMATTMPMSSCMNDVIRIKFLVENLSDKKYKEDIKKAVAMAICAWANSNGGKVEIRDEETEEKLVSTSLLDSLTRTLEQSLISRLGAEITESVDISENKCEKMIAISVCKARLLTTIKYNLYRPTKKQVELIDNRPNALKIVNRRFVDQPVQLGSHQKKILKGQDCNLGENETIQFKHLKSESSKCFTLADRMIGKSNKFNCYVSAFANHRGGHIYYGIDDNGIVRGEEIVETSKIEKKVEEAIQKMIWPDIIGRPKRGEHWEIFFEPVLDEKSNPIPSTFVIVIFIAPCYGGVFTEEPESYEMVEGKVKRMSFTTWKEKLQSVGLNKRKREVLQPRTVPFPIKRISLSPAAEKRCLMAHEVLTEAINNGMWKFFARCADQLERKYPNCLEVKLIVFARRVMGNYRVGNIHEASVLLTENQELFKEEPFHMVFLLLKAALECMFGLLGESRDIATHALTMAEHIEPGLFTTAGMLVAASTYDSPLHEAGLSPDEFCTKALEHLRYIKDAPTSRADLYHTAHITLAIYLLGYNFSGNVIKKEIDEESFQKAQESIMAVNKSICDGNPLMEYREIWFTLSQSMLYTRHSQFEPEKQDKHNRTAYKYAKKADNQAKASGLKEMACWAETTIASCIAKLLLAKLTRMKNIKVYEAQQRSTGRLQNLTCSDSSPVSCK